MILTNINFAPGATIQMSLWAKEWIEKLTNLAKNNFYNTTQDSASLERNFRKFVTTTQYLAIPREGITT